MASNGNGRKSDETTIAEVQAPPRIQRVIAMMAMEATAAENDTASLEDDFMAIFEAETKADMYEADQREPLNFKDLAGCELEIISVDVKFSKREDINTMFITADGKRMYLWVRACRIRETGDEKRNVKLPVVGEVFSVNTSARFVVAKLLWLSTHGDVNPDMAATEKVRVKGTDLGGGQEVIKLMPVTPVTVSA